MSNTSQLHIGRCELAYLKSVLNDVFVKDLVDVVVRFVRYAKEEDRARTYASGSISKTYPLGPLKVKLVTHRHWDKGPGSGISDVYLTVNGLRGSERWNLEEFVSKGEGWLIENSLLREE